MAIVVDGAECARVDDLDGGSTQRCEIQEGAKLVEIWMQDQKAPSLLATHWIEYTQWHGIAKATAEVALGNGRKLLLELVPAKQANDNPGGASILLTCYPMSRLGAWVESMRRSIWPSSLPEFAMAFASLVAIVGILGTVKYRWESVKQQATAKNLTQQLMREKAERASLQQRLEMKQDSASFVAYRLTPEDLSLRGSEGVKEAVLSLPSGAALLILELPVKSRPTSYRAVLKSFLENREVLSESSLHPISKNGNMVVTLAVPASLVEDRNHYVVDLYSTDAAGRVEKIRSFTLYVEKQ